MSGKMKNSIEEKRNLLRSLAQGEDVKEPVKEEKIEVILDKPVSQKKKITEPAKTAETKKADPITVADDVYEARSADLVNRMKNYEVGEDTKRLTYIVDRRTWHILNALKTETGASVINLINMFLDDALTANKKEIDKILKKHYQNLKL